MRGAITKSLLLEGIERKMGNIVLLDDLTINKIAKVTNNRINNILIIFFIFHLLYLIFKNKYFTKNIIT